MSYLPDEDPTSRPPAGEAPVGQPQGSPPPPPQGPAYPPVPPPAPGAVPTAGPYPGGYYPRPESPERTKVLILALVSWFVCPVLWIWTFVEARREKASYPQDTMVVVCYWVSIVAGAAFAVVLGLWLLGALVVAVSGGG